MIEIPALIWQLDQLFPLIDFASVGSNDLVQFLFASDRGNPKLAGRYDPLSPAALGAMRLIVEKAKAHKQAGHACAANLAAARWKRWGCLASGLRPFPWCPRASVR